MHLGKQLIGETTTTGDVAPVEAGIGSAARQKFFARPFKKEDDKKKKSEESFRRAGIAAAIIGLGEDRETSIIPSDASKVGTHAATGYRAGDFSGGNPTNSSSSPESVSPPEDPYASDELIGPETALVAPDATPRALQFIDASKVPGSQDGKPPAAPAPAAPASSRPPVSNTADVAMNILLGRNRPVESRASESQAAPVMSAPPPGIPSPDTLYRMTEAMTPQSGMPEHREGNVRQVCGTFRKWGPRPA